VTGTSTAALRRGPSARDFARQQAIEDYGVVDDPVPDLRGLVELAARTCEVPTAVINIIDDRWQHQVCAVGLTPDVCAREDSMCAKVIDRPGTVVVADASLDPRFATNPFVTGEIAAVRFYASSPLVTPSGVVIGTLCVFDDVTRKLTPSAAGALEVLAAQVIDVLELRRTTRELRRSNEQLTHFAAQLSHDLRNPLAALAGFLEIATDSPEMAAAAQATHALTRAESSVRRMQSMIEDLLSFASVGGAVAGLEVDLQAVATAVVEDLDGDLGAAGATVEVAGLPMVSGDPTLLRLLVQNLIANAVKFAGSVREDPRVQVSAEPEPGGWRIVVDDNGPGVDPVDRERVFELLERGTAPAVTRVGGLGIGLSTCRRIVQEHGGRIGIDTSPSGGARVWVTLPG
jgi:signal transduction histidine kinase